MDKVPRFEDPRLLVGTETADDAGVYLVSDETAIVQTVDVFTPVVDDPYIYGQIVAANCMSDVWAMGGEVITCLNLLGYPPKKMATDVAAEILRGCAHKIQESGAVLCGGHTWEDPELRVGLAVTGIVHPDKIVTNAAARPGDVLILTKPLGSGIQSFAVIKGKIEPSAIDHVIQSMAGLNLFASKAMVNIGAHACTDVTGFSLLGHAAEMAEASGVGMEIRASDVPIFDGTLELSHKNITLPLGRQNELSFRQQVECHPDISRDLIRILYDPQTSGGLLIAVPEKKTGDFLKALEDQNVTSAKVVGQVVEGKKGKIQILP